MNDFLDLTGASGATYRFRVWPESSPHLPIAGNYVFIREDANGFKVLLAGVTNDLSTVRTETPKATASKATHLFTRLNVSRAVRTAEHEDIVAHHKPATVRKAET